MKIFMKDSKKYSILIANSKKAQKLYKIMRNNFILDMTTVARKFLFIMVVIFLYEDPLA